MIDNPCELRIDFVTCYLLACIVALNLIGLKGGSQRTNWNWTELSRSSPTTVRFGSFAVNKP